MNLSRLGITERQLPYEQYRSRAMNADILLWRPTSIWSWLIAHGTSGPWSHAAAVKWLRNGRDRLVSIQYREGQGGYMAMTRDEVSHYPGKIDVFRVPYISQQQRDAISEQLMSTLGGEYAWQNIRVLSWAFLPGLRWIGQLPAVRQWLDSRLEKTGAMICSSHVDDAYRSHGVLFLKSPSGTVTPNDIGRSGPPEYVGTLV